MRFLSRIAPCEVASVDEAYLDITEIVERGHSPKEVASYIQRKLESELRIPCSIGAGSNKLIAKMCADVKKPRGFVEMGQRQHKRAATISVEVKFDYRQAVSRSITLEVPTDQADELYRTAMRIYEVHFSDRAIRLFGIRLSNLTAHMYEQLKFPF